MLFLRILTIIIRNDGILYVYNLIPEWRFREIQPEYQLNNQSRSIFILSLINFCEDYSISFYI